MKDSKINLENLMPTPSCFSLKQFGEFEFKLKPCTGGLLMDISRKIGNVEKLLGNPSAENISKMAMMLMEYDSAVKFKKQTVKTIDVLTGNEEDVDLGGYVLFAHSIQGIGEQFNIYGAILRSLGYKKEQTDDIIKKLKDSANDIVNNEIDKSVKKKSLKKK